MNNVAISVSKSLLAFCTHKTVAIDIIKEGVRLLDGEKQISGPLKKEILIEIIRLFAYGDDQIQGTLDDRLSKETIDMLLVLIESNTLELVIDSIAVKGKSIFRKCLKRFLG